ncbi:MAG: SMC-Scp complex subunit ScpB [Oscillospiraceae bacterium]|nr:SMC-Scp complex subunit ScpB [Oscillospiraceae bacterium]
MQLEQYEKIAEAILFAGGEPVDQKVVAEAMELDEDAAVAILESLKTKYEKFESSVEVRRLENQWQLCTKAEYESYIRGAFEIKRNAPLSQAALEVLAIIAYNQPVTRAFAEQVRGVDSSGVMANLAEKGLIEEAGRLDLPGRPIAYKTTSLFLRSFGLESLDDMPPIADEAETEEKAPSRELEDQQSLFDTEP